MSLGKGTERLKEDCFSLYIILYLLFLDHEDVLFIQKISGCIL